MQDAILFLPGRYDSRHIEFYEKLCIDAFKIAVDGGYSFFAKSGIVPDLLLGDFDSLKRRPKGLTSKTEVLTFPCDKDKTDTHLALDYCLEAGALQIDIVQPSVGEPDHFTANLLLMTVVRDSRTDDYSPDVRLINHKSEIRYVRDTCVSYHDVEGDRLSVIPLSTGIRLSTSGTAFDVDGLRVRRGETVSARNRIVESEASVEIGGEAFVFRLIEPQ